MCVWFREEINETRRNIQAAPQKADDGRRPPVSAHSFSPISLFMIFPASTTTFLFIS